MITIKEIAWIAGLLEGEGCFGIYNNCPTVQVNMTDLDVIERARLILDIERRNKVRAQLRENVRKTMYCLNVSGDVAIQWMMTVYSLMGIRRKTKIREIIAKWKTLESSKRRRNDGMEWGRLIISFARTHKISPEKAKEILNNSIKSGVVQ